MACRCFREIKISLISFPACTPFIHSGLGPLSRELPIQPPGLVSTLDDSFFPPFHKSFSFSFSLYFHFLKINLFIYLFRLHWVFVAACGLSLCGKRGLLFVAVHGH